MGIQHFGRPLRDRLVGCHDLLLRWGARHSTCLAGLFHSIYGTATFPQAALNTEARPLVRDRIGEQAERLAFIFCFADRRRLMLENARSPMVWVDHRDGSTHSLSEAELGELTLIEAANLVEQFPFINHGPETVIDDMEQRLTAQAHRLSKETLSDLHTALAARRFGTRTL